jgi:hypothetical protein
VAFEFTLASLLFKLSLIFVFIFVSLLTDSSISFDSVMNKRSDELVEEAVCCGLGDPDNVGDGKLLFRFE